MLPIPNEILKPFDAVMEQKPIPLALRPNYRKWLQYYLDFRNKYPPPDSKPEQVRLFIEKLRSKNQPQSSLNQAAHALSLLFEAQSRKKLECENMGKEEMFSRTIPTQTPVDEMVASSIAQVEKIDGPAPIATQKKTFSRFGRRYDEMRFREKTQSPEWDTIIEKLEGEIKARHYSRKTLIAYANWSRKFQSYLKDRAPRELSAADVKAYLTYLAVKCNVAASTQNQAFP